MVDCRFCDLQFYDNQDRADHERDVHYGDISKKAIRQQTLNELREVTNESKACMNCQALETGHCEHHTKLFSMLKESLSK